MTHVGASEPRSSARDMTAHGGAGKRTRVSMTCFMTVKPWRLRRWSVFVMMSKLWIMMGDPLQMYKPVSDTNTALYVLVKQMARRRFSVAK